MCGIVGYIGEKQAAPILLDGLAKLEYRGYDSAGLAVYKDGAISVQKAVGKLVNLVNKTDGGASLDGTLGIGHTRWATHGKPNETNAHPHTGSRFSLVHNGIIENEAKLRRKYLKDTEFVSETDTEVIVRLLDKFTEGGEDVDVAIMHLIDVLEGSYALAIIDSLDGDRMYAVKNKSPLLIGKGEGFNMIGSDAMAMIAHTEWFYEIHDKEFAIVSRDGVEIFTSYSQKIDREPYKAELDLSDVSKGTYPFFTIKEIEEQPLVIRRVLKEYQDETGELYIPEEILKDLRECDKIYIIACGTSYHAGIVGKYFFENISDKPADSYVASEFVYNTPKLTEKPFFIFISQSGETADSRAVLVKIKKMGYKALTITNVKGSTLSREANHTLLLYAGPEIAVASTKAYTAQVAVLAILAAAVENKIGINLKYELAVVANTMEGLCSDSELYSDLAREYLQNTRNCFYIGRGIDYYVCLEAALKLKEISYIQTEGFAAGELKHGTIALIEEGTPVIAIITQNNIDLNTRSNIDEVNARGAKSLIISMRSVSSHGDQIVVGDVHEMLAPLVSVVPAQYLAYYASYQRGYDVDKPRNLAKSVTVE
ncbi:MAG: glutamine--fructose-6-phosphate transaminase (isomerizing) [Oscillospiraceae bacterium]|nr:glutamine--fructose-6-phosphate transaminase (isomerizing) [Oscillospiraceae bacterium]